MIDEDLPHQTGGDPVEMSAVPPLGRILTNQPHEYLVNQRGALQGVAGTLRPEIMAGKNAQFFIHERQESVECFAVPGTPTSKQIGYLVGRKTVQERLHKSRGNDNVAEDNRLSPGLSIPLKSNGL